LKYEHDKDWHHIENRCPAKAKDWIDILSDMGLVDIMEVTDGSFRIMFRAEEDFNLSSDHIDILRKLLKCDSVHCYHNTSDGRPAIDCDYKRKHYD
jgi:hypothetical protein